MFRTSFIYFTLALPTPSISIRQSHFPQSPGLSEMSFSLDIAKQRYHVAKLTLFNVRLLHAADLSDSKDVKRLISSLAEQNAINTPVSLMHQGTFLSTAYVCIVWLWESIKSDTDIKENMLQQLPSVTDRIGIELPSCAKISGPRALDSWSAVLRLVRNSLSHSRVEIGDGLFQLTDQNTHGRHAETVPTQLTLTWPELGALSEACIHALTPVLYPPA